MFHCGTTKMWIVEKIGEFFIEVKYKFNTVLFWLRRNGMHIAEC